LHSISASSRPPWLTAVINRGDRGRAEGGRARITAGCANTSNQKPALLMEAEMERSRRRHSRVVECARHGPRKGNPLSKIRSRAPSSVIPRSRKSCSPRGRGRVGEWKLTAALRGQLRANLSALLHALASSRIKSLEPNRARSALPSDLGIA